MKMFKFWNNIPIGGRNGQVEQVALGAPIVQQFISHGRKVDSDDGKRVPVV